MNIFSIYYCCSDCCLHAIEILKAHALTQFDITLEFVDTPKQASVLLVSGLISEKNKALIQNVYHQMPDPKSVMAIGGCAINQGIFQASYVKSYPADTIIPVDVFVAGCPPTTEEILKGFQLFIK